MNLRSRRNHEGHTTGLHSKLITEALLPILRAGATTRLMPRSIAEQIADRLVQEALEGNFQAMKEVLDRTEGRVGQAREREDPAEKLTVIWQDVICRRCSLAQQRAEFLSSLEANRLLAAGAKGNSEHTEQDPSANGKG